MSKEYRFLSLNQFAKITGKNRETIAKRLSELKPASEDNRGKYYDAWEALSLIYAADRATGLDQKIQQAELEIQKERLIKLRNENELSTGKQVLIEEVVGQVGREYSFVKQKFMSLASKLAKACAIETDAEKVFALIHTQVNESLAELQADETYKKQLEELGGTKDDSQKN